MNCHEPLNSGRHVSDRINPEREKNFHDVRSGILTKMCPEHIKRHIHLNLTHLPDHGGVCSEIRTFLEAQQSSSNPDAMGIAVSMVKKVCFTIVDSEDIAQQSVPIVAIMVKEAKVRMARDRARNASQAKGKLMMAKEKAKVASGKHAWHLKGIAINVGNEVTGEKDC